MESGSEVTFAFWASGQLGFSRFEFELGLMACEAAVCERSPLRHGATHGTTNAETLVSEASVAFQGLDPGRYEFSVAAVDLAGNRGSLRLYAFDIGKPGGCPTVAGEGRRRIGSPGRTYLAPLPVSPGVCCSSPRGGQRLCSGAGGRAASSCRRLSR